MLPQPNFGRDKGPIEPEKDANGEDEKPRKKLLRLQIAMWVQVVSGVLAGNLFIFSTITWRSATLEEITKAYGEQDAEKLQETFHSTNFLVSNLAGAAVIIIAAIVAALCAVRFKSRLRAVRWWAVGATAVLFVSGMLMSVTLGLVVAPWVFAAVLSLWWLFASDVRHWMNRRQGEAPKAAEEG
jgi:magnesium-transporting ATPase (P-type)